MTKKDTLIELMLQYPKNYEDLDKFLKEEEQAKIKKKVKKNKKT